MAVFPKDELCHVCHDIIRNFKGVKPAVCPCCGTDLANPDSEKVCNTIECEHIKGFVGIGDGELFATNKRVIFVTGKMSNSGSYSQASAAGAAFTFITNKGAGKLKINIPLDNIGSIEDCKKGLRKGITLHTKDGESYNFFCSKPQELKDFFAPYVNG